MAFRYSLGKVEDFEAVKWLLMMLQKMIVGHLQSLSFPKFWAFNDFLKNDFAIVVVGEHHLNLWHLVVEVLGNHCGDVEAIVDRSKCMLEGAVVHGIRNHAVSKDHWKEGIICALDLSHCHGAEVVDGLQDPGQIPAEIILRFTVDHVTYPIGIILSESWRIT